MLKGDDPNVTMSDENELEIQGLSVGYGNTQVLIDFSVSVRKGELFTLVGPSGSGKSTLLLCVAGFLPAKAGTISLSGQDITFVSANKREIGMVFQSYTLFPHMTVLENVTYSLAIRRQSKEKISQRAAELFSLLHLQDVAHRYPLQLSGGQQQRVALARALAFSPNLLLLDEPLGALDRKLRIELQSEIRRVQVTEGTSALYVTHDQKEAMAISDRIAVLSKGRIQQIGTPREIYDDPSDPFVADFFGGANLLPVRLLECGQNACVVELAGLKIEEVPRPKFVTTSGVRGILMVRPESWIVARGPSEEHAEISSSIQEVTFEGDSVTLRCLLPEGVHIIARGAARELAGLGVNDIIYVRTSGPETRLFGQPGS